MAQAKTSSPKRYRPNIVFILCDNVGWGDFSCYGGNTPTPRIDKFASEGIRFNNYTVESQCTPSRSAIMTGRQSVRSGTFRVPIPGEGPSGLAPWEYTIAELLSDAGYATSLFGKWHLGEVEGRLPSDQGFDEWWGYKNSADEAGYSSYATFRAIAKLKGIESPKIWQGKNDGCPVACLGDAPFGYVNVFTSHVNVGFFHGAALPDPHRLLQGTGKFMRHVKLRAQMTTNAAALTDLIEDAYSDIKARVENGSDFASIRLDEW